MPATAPAHADIAMQTAGCRNGRPLFRDCSLQWKYLPQRVEAQTTFARAAARTMPRAAFVAQ